MFLLARPASASAQCSGSNYDVCVSPHFASVTRPAMTSGYTADFIVQNVSWSTPHTFFIGCSISGPVTCTSVSASQVYLAPQAWTTVTATYSVQAAGTGHFSLYAYYGSGVDQGDYTVTVLEQYLVAVTPDTATTPVRAAFSTGLRDTFLITNAGYYSDTYTITCGGTAGVTCTGTSAPSVTLNSGASMSVVAYYTTGSPATGTLTLTASSTGHTSDGGRYTVPIVTVAIDLTPHNGEYRDVTKCVAECFDATARYTTPAYVSLDQTRAVTLVYRSSQARPTGVVQVDVTDNTAPAPGMMSIRLQRPDQTWVTFTNGSQEIFYSSGAGSTRLAAQFDASGLVTGAYDYTLVARSWRSGSFTESTWPVRVLILNESGSSFGWGWSMLGLQRLYVQSGGSVVISDGDGSIGYFRRDSCPSNCTFIAPAGDFTTVTTQGTWPTVTSYQRRYPNGTIATFNPTGLLTSMQDRFANTTSYVYDGSNRLSTITDPASKVITFSYGADGKLDWIRDPGTPNRYAYLTIDGAFNVTQITDPANVAALRPAYDALHRMTTRLDRRGSPSGFSYDFAGKLAADTMPTITADGQPVRPVTLFSSLERNSLIDPASGLGTSTSPGPRVIPANLRAMITNPRGFETRFALNRFGAALRIEEPLGRTTRLVRNPHSQLAADTTPSGHVTESTWSGPRLTQTVDRTTGRTVNIGYELTYNEVMNISGDVEGVANGWSGGKLMWTVRQGRPSTIFTYDSRGRVTKRTDPGGHVTWFYYAATGWQNTDSVVAPSGLHTVFTYDAYGRRASVKNPSVTTFQYDSLNRTVRVVGPLSDTTRFDYDSLYVRSLTDGLGQRYEYVRNALGWIETRRDPGSRYTYRYYDRNGNLTTENDPMGRSVTFTYDALDQLAVRTADGATTTYAFDPAQRFRAAARGESVDTLKFDVAGRPQAEITVLAGTRYERTATYNVRDQRTALEVIAPWRDTISYRYNANMMLDTLIDLKGDRTTLVYDNDVLLRTVALPPPTLTITRVAHSTHLPSQITYYDATVNGLIGLNFDIDLHGRVWRRKKVAGDTTWTFTPDSVGRIVRYSTTGVDSTFSYDKVGNRTDRAAIIGSGNRLFRFGADSLVYDPDGRLIQRIRGGSEVQRLYWDRLGELTAVWTSGQDSVSFGYDGFGRRVRKTSSTGTVRYVWDGDDLLAELDGGGNRLAEYTYYPGVDQIHSMRRGGPTGETYYFAQDFPGNVIGLFNTAGNLIWQYRYSAFGADLPGFPRGAVPVENTLRFAGRQLDTETGLYYVRARYFDPRLARFISEDAAGLQGGMNPYVYAGNNPANYTDPSGQFIFAIIGFIAIAGAEVAAGATVIAAVVTAATVMGAVALGSAVAAGVESLVTGKPFWEAFDRNIDIAGAYLAGSVALTLLPGVSYAGAGANGIFQGYVKLNEPIFGGGGLTLGSASVLSGVQGLSSSAISGLLAHELGHTFQFIMLSGFGNPWGPYLALGGLGLLSERGILPEPGGWWEDMASILGRGGQCAACVLW